MRIGIVIPPIRDFYFTPHRASFLGAEILKNIILKNTSHEVEIINLINLKKKPKIVSLPDYLNYLSEYLNKEFFFKNYKHFGLDFDNSVNIINKFNLNAIIFSCFAFCYSEELIELCKKIRKTNKNLFIAVGGQGVTVFPEFFENTQLFDLIICGEIETNFDEVLISIEKRKKGIIFLNTFTNEENMEFVIKKTYETKKICYYSTILSRGCSKNCNFCSNHLIFGKKFRTIPIEKIEKEVKKINFPNKKIFINFEDDNILFAKEYLFEVIKILKKYIKNPLFSFENGIDYMLLTEKEMEKLIKFGVRQFNFSFVNLNKEILKNENRKVDVEKLKNLLFLANKLKINTITYIIAGLKNDSFKNLISNLMFLSKLPTIIGYSPFYPVPGIKGFEKEKFFNYPQGLLKATSMYPWNKSLSTYELVRGFNVARAINRYKYLENISS